MSDLELRLHVNAHLKEMGEPPITEKQMGFALEQQWSHDYDRTDEKDAKELAQTIAEHRREWRAAPLDSDHSRAPSVRRGGKSTGAEEGAPRAPQWWLLGESQVWARYEAQRREMAALFGLLDERSEARTLDAVEMPAIIEEVAQGERPEGDWLLLEVPKGWKDTLVAADGSEDYGLDSEVRPVWRGFHRPPPIARDGLLRESTPAERAAEQRLYRLAEAAQRIAGETGCLPGEAVEYLLGGEKPFLPYVDVTFDPRYRGYVVVVRDRRIPVGDVAAYYRHYRDRFGSLARQPKEAPYLVVQFVEEARAAEPRLTWRELFERFDAEYPDRYGSMKSFRQTFYTKRSTAPGKRRRRPKGRKGRGGSR